jgi:hypothetical protein
MPSLRELQYAVRRALLDGDDAALTDAITSDGLAPAARLAVYRHHVLTSLAAALEATFPVVARLVDPRFFRYACDQYVRAEPPATPCLFEYGATFADFLAGFPPCRHLVYLPDVARLEWAMNVALHAPDAAPLTAEALRTQPAGTVETAPVALHPSVTLLESPWPIDALWRANQPGGDGVVDLDAGGTRVCVWRRGDDVVFRALSPVAFAFRRALATDGSLAPAAAAALAVDGAVDLAWLVREVLDDEVLECR